MTSPHLGRRVLLAAAAMALLLPSSVADARPRRLTGAELRRLERGRIIRRPLEDDRRGLVGGTSYIVIDAPLDAVWRAMQSLPAFRTMFPSVDRIRLLESEGVRRVVRIEQEGDVATFTWVVALAFDERRHEVRFRLDRNHRHIVDDGWGYVRLAAHGAAGDRTLVTFGAVIDPGDDALVQDMLNDRAERRMLGMPRRLKRHVVGSVLRPARRPVAAARAAAAPDTTPPPAAPAPPPPPARAGSGLMQ
ncbi:MAG: SRPBCC family protein [Micrococcales bacterium]|nr:SRPBCC family protein [Micrococcales bacterium]